MAYAIGTSVVVTQRGYAMSDMLHIVCDLLTTDPETGENSPTPPGEEPSMYIVKRVSDPTPKHVLVDGVVTIATVLEDSPCGVASEFVTLPE